MSHIYPSLQPYGWSEQRIHQLAPGTLPARVIRHDGSTLLGVTPYGPRVLRAAVRLDPQPTVGDWVAVPGPDGGSGPAAPATRSSIGSLPDPLPEPQPDPLPEPQPDPLPEPQPDPLPILEVLPRRSLLRRQSADGVGEQALAANVDVVLITCGIDRPIRAGRIQRLAAQAWDCGAMPVLVLTKAANPGDVDLPRLELEHPGVQVLATAALEGVGVDEVRAVVAARTAVLVGESGAGKSTLANALLGDDRVTTGAVRTGDAKGRHTTTSRQLHLVPTGGAIIDTPGIRSIGLATDRESLDAVFSDTHDLAVGCRFSDCDHDTEPGCAVKEALHDGTLARERYDGWRRLRREVASAALRSSPHEYRAAARQFGRRAKEAQVLKRR